MNYSLTHRPDLVLLLGDDDSQKLIHNDSRYPEYLAEWADYQKWLEAGNTPTPYAEPVIPPPLTLTQKLTCLGIDLTELKTLLN